MKLTSEQKQAILDKQQFYSDKNTKPYMSGNNDHPFEEVFTEEVIEKIVKHRYNNGKDLIDKR